MENGRITLYPYFRNGTISLRLTYGSNSIGASFPTVAGNTLPTSISIPAEEAAILYAVAKLQARDNEFDAATFIMADFEARVLELVINQNRLQRGSFITAHNPDYYVLDGDSNAW